MTPEQRERMRTRIREKLSTAVLPGARPEHPGVLPLNTTAASADDLLDGFVREFTALTGIVHHATDAASAAAVIRSIIPTPGPQSILAWSESALRVPGLYDALAAQGIGILPAHVPFSGPERTARLGELAAAQVGVTGALACLAESGSLVVEHGDGRGRLASLLVPVHIAIVRRSAVVRSLADVFRHRPDLTASTSNVVVITGPSRTADIEMTLTRGVHGPREIHVILM